MDEIDQDGKAENGENYAERDGKVWDVLSFVRAQDCSKDQKAVQESGDKSAEDDLVSDIAAEGAE